MRWSLLVLTALAACAAEEVVLLRGGTIHPVSGPDIAAGAVLIQNGRIVEVGAKVSAPKGVRVVDVKGLHVYPGMIDSSSNLGLTEIGSVSETNDTTEMGLFKPQLRAAVAVNPASEHIPVTRANGITAAVVAPAGGVIRGHASLVHLDGWTWEEMALRPAVALEMTYPRIQTSVRGATSGRPAAIPPAEAKKRVEGELRQLEEFFESARRYQKAKAAAASDFKVDLRLEAMLPALEGKLPVAISAYREKDIRGALALGEKHKLRIVLESAGEAWKLASELAAKKIPVILPSSFRLPDEEDQPYDKPQTIPAELYKAGVKFAFAGYVASSARNLPYQAAMAVAHGLPYEEALKALTLYPAEIWGVSAEMGSIEKGKWADLVVTDGDPLEIRTQVKQLYIKGRPVDLDNKHKRLYEKYLNRP